MNKLKYGILSTASIIPRFINSVNESQTGTIQALASRDLKKAQEKAERYQIPIAYGSYEALIADKDIDIIYVAMVNSEHYKYTKLALEAGKHVLCEKPFTLLPEEAEELFVIARKNNCFLMEAQKVVFLPVIQEIKKIIESGELGAVTMIDCISSYDVSVDYNWFYNAQLGGGLLYGNGLYSIQMAQFLFNCRIHNYTGLCTKGNTEVDNQFSTVMTLENGVLLINKSSVCVETKNCAYIYGEKGYVKIPDYWKARKADIYFNNGETRKIEYPCEHEMIYEVIHVYDCIHNNMIQSPIMNEDVTVRGIKILADLKDNWS